MQSASQPYHPNLQRPNRYDNDRIQYIVSVVRCFVLPIPLYIPIFWYRFHPRKAMIGSHVTECASTANGPRPHCATRHDGTRSRPGYAPANVTRPGTGRASSLRLRTGQVGLKGAWQPRWSRDSLAPTLYSKMVKGTRTLLKNAILIAKVSLVGGALGWVLFTAAQCGGVGFVPVSVDSVPFDYCEAPAQW